MSHELAETATERCIVRRSSDHVDVVRAGPPEARGQPVGQIAPHRREAPFQRAGAGRGVGVEQADGDGRHPPSLARGGSALAGRVRAYVGLGANVGDAAATLAAAVAALAAMPGARLVRVSRLYVTVPIGVADQPDFHNAAAALDVPAGATLELGATALLAGLKQLERAFGRRARGHWGPRELDLDLLVFGRARLSVPRAPAGESDDPAKVGRPLEVPHPEARRRLFVLAPLADLAPGLVPPGWGERVRSARDRQARAEGREVVRPVASWAREGGWRLLDSSADSYPPR